MPDQRDAAAVMTDWRAVEREIELVKELTDPALVQDKLRALHADARRLRNEYQRLIQGALTDQRPFTPPDA